MANSIVHKVFRYAGPDQPIYSSDDAIAEGRRLFKLIPYVPENLTIADGKTDGVLWEH